MRTDDRPNMETLAIAILAASVALGQIAARLGREEDSRIEDGREALRQARSVRISR